MNPFHARHVRKKTRKTSCAAFAQEHALSGTLKRELRSTTCCLAVLQLLEKTSEHRHRLNILWKEPLSSPEAMLLSRVSGALQYVKKLAAVVRIFEFLAKPEQAQTFCQRLVRAVGLHNGQENLGFSHWKIALWFSLQA